MNATQLIVIAVGLGYFWFVFRSRGKVDFSEFAVGSRRIGVFLTFATLAATYVGPAMTLGLSRSGFSTGWLYLPFGLLASVNLYLTARFISARIRERFPSAQSLGDLVGGKDSHNNRAAKFIAGILGFAVTAAVSVVMSKAGGELISHVFGMPSAYAIVLMTALVTVYSSVGGIRATIQTDAFQFACFVILLPLLAVFIFSSSGLSFSSLVENSRAATQSSWDTQTAMSLFGLSVFWLIGGGLDPTYVNRMLAARTPQVSRKATMGNAAFAFGWFLLMILLGNLARVLDPQLADTDRALLSLAQDHFGVLLYGVFIVAMIGVIMSSQDSMLNGASVVFASDIVGVFKKEISDDEKLKLARVSTVAIGLLAIFTAIYVDSILQAIILIWSVYTPALLPVILFSLYLKRFVWQAAVAAMVVAIVVGCVWVFAGWGRIFPTTLAGLIASLASYGLAYVSFLKSSLDPNFSHQQVSS